MTDRIDVLKPLFLSVVVLSMIPFDCANPIPKDELEKEEKSLDELMARFKERLQDARESVNDYYQKQKTTTDKFDDRQREINETRDTLPETTERNFTNVKRNIFSESDESDELDENSLSYNFGAPSTVDRRNYRHRSGATALITATAIIWKSWFYDSSFYKEKTEVENGVKNGVCRGFLMYQHNLKITGARQFSNAHSIDVNIQGTCITCVEAVPRNNKKANVIITSGGPGYEYVSIEFDTKDNYEYSIKIWSVIGRCSGSD